MTKQLESGRTSLVIPFVIGGLVGAAAGLLFAPKPGNQVRSQIRHIASGTKDRIVTTWTKGLDLYDDTKIAVVSAVEAGRQAYLQEREKFQTAN